MDGGKRAFLRQQAELAWRAGLAAQAVKLAERALASAGEPNAEDFLFLAGFHFHAFQFDKAIAVLRRGMDAFPDHPTLRLNLGGSLLRAGKPRDAVAVLLPMAEEPEPHPQLHIALAHALGDIGDDSAARRHGTMALAAQDAATAELRGRTKLDLDREPLGKKKVVAFTLFGMEPRYTRGALHNVLAARTVYPGWVCRFYVDDSVDPMLLDVLREEGAEIVHEERVAADRRWRLSRRFQVADDPEVGHFLVRDCDAVVSEREARAVEEWLASDCPFHAIRDWYSHTSLMLAGLWGGVAGVFPDLTAKIDEATRSNPDSTNWDQDFLRSVVWPQIRDCVLVHDRMLEGHRTTRFPGRAPPFPRHVGENHFAVDRSGQAALLAPFATKVPSLGLKPGGVSIRLPRRSDS